MYVPTQFAEDSLPVLHEAMRAARLVNLVTLTGEGLVASPIPMMLDAEDGPKGALIGHLSRANPQWRTTDAKVPALALFMGPDAYVTPSWYETKKRDGKVVPTWNYVTIHAYGPIEFFEDSERLLGVVSRLTDHHEAGRGDPWAVTDAPDGFIAAQLKGIVGFRLAIERIEGKWKLSQNRNQEDRGGVIAGLGASEDPTDQAVAALIKP